MVLGVVFDPNRDEIFVAKEGGGGARLNGNLIGDGGSLSKEKNEIELRDAILCVGCPPDPEAFAKNLKVGNGPRSLLLS